MYNTGVSKCSKSLRKKVYGHGHRKSLWQTNSVTEKSAVTETHQRDTSQQKRNAPSRASIVEKEEK